MPFPALTLSATKSKLNELVLKEAIDVAVLDKLINSDLLKDSFHNPTAKMLFSDEREQLIAYKKLIKLGFAEVKYVRSEGMSFGRCNPVHALGLFSIRREIRHTLAKNTYTDVDIENCHPAILVQICKKNDIECDNLEDYVVNRATYLTEVMTTYKVSRDTAKKLFIQLLFFGSFDSWAEKNGVSGAVATKNIKNFKKELNAIGEVIVSNNKAIAEEVKAKKTKSGATEYNEKGSVVSNYLQELECRILEKIYLYCKTKCLIPGDVNCVLCADGIMLVKEHYNDTLLTAFTKVIKDEFDLNLTFTTKEMNQDFLAILDDHILTEDVIVARKLTGYDINITIDTETDFNINTMNTFFFRDIETIGEENYIKYFNFTNSFKYFNAYHAHFYMSNRIYKIFKNEVIAYGGEFLTTFNHLNLELEIGAGKSKKKISKRFTDMFLEDRYKRCYSSFHFKPNNRGSDDKFNLFTGFRFTTDDNDTFEWEIIEPFVKHIEFICGEDAIEGRFDDVVVEEGKPNKFKKPITTYFINWLSHIIKKPEIKTEVAIILFSITEGVGKNIISDIFGEIVKGYNAKFRDTSALTDKFNADMMGKLFVVGDEINARANEVANELKDIITRKQENIELKGKDKFLIDDFKNYFFTTNNENVFKISNSDRRFVMIEAPDNKKTVEYYKVLVDFKNDEAKLKQLFNYFMSRDISTFIPQEIVKTDYKKNLILANIPAFIKFAKEEHAMLRNSIVGVPELYKMSIEYAKSKRMISTYTERLFSVQFKKVFGDFNGKESKTNRSVYIFPDDKILPDGSVETLEDQINALIMKNFVGED
jgi:hypothetical protein